MTTTARIPRHLAAYLAVAGTFILATLAGMVAVHGASGAASACPVGSGLYVVVGGDTLGAVASRYHTTWQQLWGENHLADPNRIFVGQHLCIRGSVSQGGAVGPSSGAVRGLGNPYPYGQCTWYADERYHQLSGIYVPWSTNANAWQWRDRAYEFHWRVSQSPTIGSIVDLQPWVQGAFGLGHVAVVERVLGNGHVIASNMNWAPYPWLVTNIEIAPGNGVSFITY